MRKSKRSLAPFTALTDDEKVDLTPTASKTSPKFAAPGGVTPKNNTKTIQSLTHSSIEKANAIYNKGSETPSKKAK